MFPNTKQNWQFRSGFLAPDMFESAAIRQRVQTGLADEPGNGKVCVVNLKHRQTIVTPEQTGTLARHGAQK